MKITVRANEIATLLDRCPAGVTTLSLDCFDTLLWRNVQAPRDVFAALPIPGGGVEPRMAAERTARRARMAARGQNEVTLDAIYRRLLPRADPAALAVAIARECAAEADHCYGFAPVVALMRDAKARGLEVVIVSDTYFDEPQLRALIGAAAGAEVLALIDRVFVSSAFGIGKGDGLFGHVLTALGRAPAQLLHLGDNRIADQVAPAALGIATAHFRQFEPGVEQRLRLEAAAATLVEPASRITVPVVQPHRPALALRDDLGAAEALGHDVLGPVLHAFAEWVKRELDARSDALGRPVKPVFLLRDGHLPKRVFEALYPKAGAVAVEVSRFAAAAASLTDAAAIARYASDALDFTPPEVVGRQLLLHGNEIAPLVRGPDPAKSLRRGVADPQVVRKIVRRAAAYADRLAAHLARAGIGPGDAVMLVDLGYNGSVQNLVEPMLRARLGLEVSGRYLLLREQDASGLDKSGLLDTRHYDMRMLNALCGCVAVIEQLCTVAQGSVVDYAADGTPVRKDAGIKGAQSAIREAVQAACVGFATADRGVHRPARADDADARRRMAAACLARLLFMPSADEVALFEAFDHDVNLGTSEVVRLLDSGEAGEGLRRRGLSYLNETGRMFVPGELQGHGLPLNLSLFASTRFALDLRASDFEVGGVDVPVILADAHGQTVAPFRARPTAEGYYRLAIPIGAGRFTAAIQLGQPCAWVQVEEACFVSLADFDANARVPGVAAASVADAMTPVAPGLYEAEPNGLLIVPPPAAAKAPLVLTLIFRPVVWRDATQLRKAA